jgi:hypothetical protein
VAEDEDSNHGQRGEHQHDDGSSVEFHCDFRRWLAHTGASVPVNGAGNRVKPGAPVSRRMLRNGGEGGRRPPASGSGGAQIGQ